MPSRKSARARETASAIGEIIADKYKVIRVLGQGGFGTVYLVEIVAGMVGEKLALKVLSSEFSSNATVRDQFLNEIRVAMKMVDRYIVQIRDVGTTADGRVYYTMDYCEGRTLLDILRAEGRLPYRRAILIMLKVLRALRTAHSRGIIHRDLKPANIMVDTENGRDSVRVLDFGIATALRGTDSDAGQRGVSGSPPYMPPEQFLGEKLGLYTDLYAVGAILYECLTGQKPYPGRSAKEIFAGLKRGPPAPPEQLQPEVTECPGLSETVMKALERNPERRFQNPREFFDQLGGLLSEEAAPETPPRAAAGPRGPAGTTRRAAGPRRPARRRQRRGVGAGPWILLLLVILAAGVVLFVLRDELGLSDLSRFLSPVTTSPRAASETPAAPSDGSPVGGSPSGASPSAAQDGTPETATAETPDAPASAAASATGQDAEPGGRGPLETSSERPGVETRRPDPDELLARAARAFEERDWNGVLDLAGQVVERQSGNARALRLLGIAHARRGNVDDAEQCLEKARGSLEDSGLLLELARVKTRKEPPQWAAVEQLLEAARRLEGHGDSEINALLATALDEQKKHGDLRGLLVTTKERRLDFPGFAALWKKHLVDAPAALWTEMKSAGTAAREARERGEVVAALQSATRAIDLAAKLKEYGEHAPEAESRALDLAMRLLSAEIAVCHPTVVRLEPDAIAQLLSPLARAIRESPESIPPSMGMDWNYLSGRLELLEYEAKPKKSRLENAERYLTEARRLAENEDRRDQDTEFLATVHSWVARIYAHRADYPRVVDHLKSARDVRDLGEIYEQAWTYFLTGTKTRADERVDCFQKAADRVENITNLSPDRVPKELYVSSLDLLGRCYLMRGRYEEKQNLFRYASNKLVEARNLGRRTPELYRDLGAAYEEFDVIRAAQTYRDLYENIERNACNCLLAAEMYIRATENTGEARNIVNDGLNRVRDEDRATLQKALQAIESARSRRGEDKLLSEIEKLRRIACK